MQYKCVTYTSLAALDLSERQLLDIGSIARDLNAIDGITGVLIFNGTHFLQFVEGPPAAVEDLIDRLRRDERHSGLEIRDERMADGRLFADWSMKMVRVRSEFAEAHEDVLEALPAGLPEPARERVIAMVQLISEEVDL